MSFAVTKYDFFREQRCCAPGIHRPALCSGEMGPPNGECSWSNWGLPATVDCAAHCHAWCSQEPHIHRHEPQQRGPATAPDVGNSANLETAKISGVKSSTYSSGSSYSTYLQCSLTWKAHEASIVTSLLETVHQKISLRRLPASIHALEKYEGTPSDRTRTSTFYTSCITGHACGCCCKQSSTKATSGLPSYTRGEPYRRWVEHCRNRADPVAKQQHRGRDGKSNSRLGFVW